VTTADLTTLVRLLGAERAGRWGAAIDAKLGALAGNVFLGFGLGSMGTFGEILGLPLDIRHIAFASAELGTSLEVLRDYVPIGLIATVGLGVAAIGLINFLVSFGLSLMVALESRRLSNRNLLRLARGLVLRFFRRPLEWFVPPRPGAPHRA
jgi:site-specific recombinase